MVQNERESRLEPQASEELARLVLACRDLALRIDAVVEDLPARALAPFLYGQLDAAVDGLRHVLTRLSAQEDERHGLLHQLLGTRKKRPTPTEAGADLQGNAWTIAVGELVNFLAHAEKTGVLHVVAQGETFLLEFARGTLVHASSNAAPKEQRLGAILEREGLLVPDELEASLLAAAEAEDLLGSFLVRRGRLSSETLARALVLQTQELFHRLMDADNAVYRFQEGVRLLHSQNLEVNIVQLLLESARKKDEGAQARVTADLDAQPSLLPKDGALPATAELSPTVAITTPAADETDFTPSPAIEPTPTELES
ncbi:MAG: DUF4388 domain-containing protein [Planctomycetes bacterium]|nr:DUF4388 domain-containing protein [Planctomycetota bacterium]